MCAVLLSAAVRGLLLQRKLMERNVAEEIAGKVVDSVAQSLEGQKLSSFTGDLRPLTVRGIGAAVVISWFVSALVPV